MSKTKAIWILLYVESKKQMKETEADSCYREQAGDVAWGGLWDYGWSRWRGIRGILVIM